MQDGLKTHNQKYTHQKCFVGHSHKAPWHDDIISACEETLPKFGLQPWYADDQFEPTKSLRDKVVEMVANARYGLYDLSWWRPDEQSAWKMPQNVLIELGMAIALNRPVLLLRHAENRASGLSLPACLDSINQRIVEFSGGPTLKHALEERLPQWLDVPPERAWWARYCLFGERVCTYRESYPQIIQCGQKTIGCHIADGQDIDRPDFRSLIEDELSRYSDISFDYLDTLLPTAGYDFQLCTYCQIVRSTPFAIYRITPQTTAEAFITIGMSIALEKQFKCEIPKFIFTTDARSVPSLLAGYEVVETKTAKERQKRLRKFIPVVMRKIRESVWKPEALPFVEFVPRHAEIVTSEKEQRLFEAGEEKVLSGVRKVSERFDNAIADVARTREVLGWAELLQLMEDVINNSREIEYVTKLARKALELNKAFQLHQNVLNTMAECNSMLRGLTDDKTSQNYVAIPQAMREYLRAISGIVERFDNTIADVARTREALSWVELLQLMEDVMNNPRDIEYVTMLARKARDLNKVFQLHQNVLNTMAECNMTLRRLVRGD
jgi:predicted protein tyrosine phosphatase